MVDDNERIGTGNKRIVFYVLDTIKSEMKRGILRQFWGFKDGKIKGGTSVRRWRIFLIEMTAYNGNWKA